MAAGLSWRPRSLTVSCPEFEFEPVCRDYCDYDCDHFADLGRLLSFVHGAVSLSSRRSL